MCEEVVKKKKKKGKIKEEEKKRNQLCKIHTCTATYIIEHIKTHHTYMKSVLIEQILHWCIKYSNLKSFTMFYNKLQYITFLQWNFTFFFFFLLPLFFFFLVFKDFRVDSNYSLLFITLLQCYQQLYHDFTSYWNARIGCVFNSLIIWHLFLYKPRHQHHLSCCFLFSFKKKKK